MGLFDAFRRKRTPASPRPHRVADTGKPITKFPQLRDAWVAIGTEMYEQALRLAGQHVEAEDRELQHEAKKIIGIIKFRQRHYTEALGIFREIVPGSRNASDWFSLATAATMSGEIDLGAEAFAKALECPIEQDSVDRLPTLFMHLFYASALRDMKEYSRALAQIEPIKQAYQQLKITDDTFVYIREVPMLPHTMRVAMDIFRGLGARFDWRSWIRGLSESIDDEGKMYLTNCIRELEAGGSQL
ncbi:MAG TPA: hypothetical protein VNA25_01335 [Phycisphaerae bacterium]|nr:hypothetical protein [Phycisphaerae bacterium]